MYIYIYIYVYVYMYICIYAPQYAWEDAAGAGLLRVGLPQPAGATIMRTRISTPTPTTAGGGFGKSWY